MAAEFFRELFHHFPWDSSTPRLYKDNERKPIPLEPRVDELLTKASFAQMRGQQDEARSLYVDMATMAKTVYENIETQRITASERLSRAQHAEIAVIGFINAGELDDAINFGENILEDPLIPQISKDRVQKAIELLGQTS